MTVQELIAELQKLPQQHEVVVDLHSEFSLAGKPTLITGYDNGGYISESYSPEAKLRAHDYVLISHVDRYFPPKL